MKDDNSVMTARVQGVTGGGRALGGMNGNKNTTKDNW